MIRQFTGFKDKDKDLMLKDKDNNTGLHVSEECILHCNPRTNLQVLVLVLGPQNP